MKTLGLIGGTSWLSTADYYRIINQNINKKLGGIEAAKLFMYSINFGDLKRLTDAQHWQEISTMLCSTAQKLEQAGAECIVICANAPHKFAEDVQAAVGIPLLHIADVTAIAIRKKSIQKVVLLGTKVTMEEDFYKNKLAQHQLTTIIPDTEDREFIHNSIFTELGKGIFTPEAKARYLQIIQKLTAQGAEGIIFCCTEIPLLITQANCTVPVFDTLTLHAEAAVAFALGD